jgi:cupin fold WbuC family metalloprotein
MKITQALMDELTAQAKASPRLRMNRDLRNSPEDKSQRMLNALEPETIMPIHRHQHASLESYSAWLLGRGLNNEFVRKDNAWRQTLQELEKRFLDIAIIEMSKLQKK